MRTTLFFGLHDITIATAEEPLTDEEELSLHGLSYAYAFLKTLTPSSEAMREIRRLLWGQSTFSDIGALGDREAYEVFVSLFQRGELRLVDTSLARAGTPLIVRKKKEEPPPPPPAPEPKVKPRIRHERGRTIVVPKDYFGDHNVTAHRIPVRLVTDETHDGTASFNCDKSDKIKVFDRANGGDAKDLPLELTGVEVTGGKTLYIEAVSASDAVKDIELTLSLSGGSKPTGGPAKSKITCIELNLALCKRRPDDGGDPEKLSDEKKLNPGRYVLLQKDKQSERAMVVIEQTTPADYNGNVLLRTLNPKVTLYKGADEHPADGQAAIGQTYRIVAKDIPDAGKKLWVEGVTKSGALKDSGFKLELEEFGGHEGDRVVMTVLKTCINVFGHRMQAGVPLPPFLEHQKLDPGRVVHLQEGKTHARAKVVIEKVEPAGFSGTMKLSVLKANAASTTALKIFKSNEETPSPGQNAANLPLEIDYRDTMPEGDRTFWIEGAEESDAAHDIEIRLGVKEVDRGSDRVGFTVVKLDTVKPADLYVAGADQGPYDGNTYERYINVAYNAASNLPHGRRIKIRASLSKQIQNIKIHFMLAPHTNNGRAANNEFDHPAQWNAIPNALKHSDRADPARTNDAADPAEKLHHSALTNAQGFAEREMDLSKIGGDIFFAGAYIGEEPQLGKYVHGDLAFADSAPTLSNKIHVWRKLWAQMTRTEGLAPPAPNTAVEGFRRSRIRFVPTVYNQINRVGAPAGVFYQRWMYLGFGRSNKWNSIVGGRDSHTPPAVGVGNKAALYAPAYRLDNAAHPNKVHVIVCDAQWDLGRTSLKTFNLKINAKGLNMGEVVVDPPLGGGDIKITAQYRHNNAWHQIPSANISISKSRLSRGMINIRLPNAAPKPSLFKTLKIRVRARCILGPYLGESPPNGRDIIVVFNPKEIPDFNDTIAHEIGHTYNQTPRNGGQPPGLANHPGQVDHGQGNHCTDRACIMYESGPQKQASHYFCRVCHPYMLGEDFSINIPKP